MKLRAAFENFIRRITYGRYGYDEMSRFHVLSSLLPILISLCTSRIAKGYVSLAFYLIAMTSILWSTWRSFSRDFAARKRENDRFLRSRPYLAIRNAYIRFSQRRDYCFFRCPECGNRLRVPRGKGAIEITCPSCKHRFRKKT